MPAVPCPQEVAVFENFNLTKLPPHGKLFVSLFCVLVLLVVGWMTVLGLMEAKILGAPEFDEESAFEEYDAQADIQTIALDDQAVTTPDWSDSGDQEPIGPEDIDEYEEYAEEQFDEEEYALTFWEKFRENMEWSMGHLSTQTILFFALGFLFVLTTYSAGIKKLFIWLLAIFTIVHAFGIAGFEFCRPATMFTWIGGLLLLIIMFIMSLMILVNVRKKA